MLHPNNKILAELLAYIFGKGDVTVTKDGTVVRWEFGANGDVGYAVRDDPVGHLPEAIEHAKKEGQRVREFLATQDGAAEELQRG